MAAALHQRAVIRHAVRNQLRGKTAAETRVEATRVLPYRKAELPAIAIYTLEEEVDKDSAETAPRILERDLDLKIEGWLPFSEDVDDDMDALALQIEKAMDADRYFNSSVKDSVLASTNLAVITEGEGKYGYVLLSYDVTYETSDVVNPDDADDFETAHVVHKTGGADQDDNDDAEDDVVVQEVP